MTGSDSTTTPCKGTGRPSLQQQREAGKSEMDPTDQLRRLAIKNSYHGNKSHPGSPLPSKRAVCSSSTSSLNQIPSIAIQDQPAESYSASALVDCKLPPLPQSPNTTTTEKVQPAGPQKSTPYITRQELLHSLRRTSSNFSVGVTQTTCSGTSSYVHYTPRHLARTNFNPRPSLSRAATNTPDSGLGKSELTLPGDDEYDGESGDSQETMSMVELHVSRQHNRLSPTRLLGSHGRSLRSASPGVVHYRSVEVSTENRQHHASVKSNRIETRVSQISQNGNCTDFRRTTSEGLPALTGTRGMARRQTQKSPQRQGYLNGGAGGYNLETNTCSNQTHLPAISAVGPCSVASRRVAMAAPDAKLKLHIPQGRKTASLV